MYGSRVSKSAGGSLNARWPFSPIPTNATSMGAAGNLPSHGLTHQFRIAFAVDQVHATDARGPDEAFLQVAPETGRMRRRQAQVLVEMKQLDAVPRHAMRRGQMLEEVELGGAGCRDDARGAARGDGVVDGGGGFGRRMAPERERVVEDADIHGRVAPIYGRPPAAGSRTIARPT